MFLPPRHTAAIAAALVAGCGSIGPVTEPTETDDIESSTVIGIEPVDIAGPFDDQGEYCNEMKKAGRRCAGVVEEITDEMEPPYEYVEILRVRPRRGGIEYCEIAIATPEGWYVTEELFICGESDADVEAEVTNLELVTQKYTAPIVRAEATLSDRSEAAHLTTQSVVLCGVGDLGISCTRPFVRVEHVLHADGTEEHRAASMTLSRFGVLKVNGEMVVDGEILDATGAYRIEFP